MNKPASLFASLVLLGIAAPGMALSMAPEEFKASREMACVLAQQSLGQLSEDEYGARTHTVLEGFDNAERDAILAKAIGYYDGLLFEIADDDKQAVTLRLENFVQSGSCSKDYRRVTFNL